jgi:hypothetical protein
MLQSVCVVDPFALRFLVWDPPLTHCFVVRLPCGAILARVQKASLRLGLGSAGTISVLLVV